MPVETYQEFEAWLNEQSQEVCVTIAYRAAMRVLPLATRLRWPVGDTGLALSTLRAILTSGVAAVGSTRDVISAADAAAARAADAAARAAADAAAARAARAAAAGAAASAAAGAADAAADAAAARAAFAAAFADTDLPPEALMAEPISMPAALREVINQELADADNALSHDDGPWEFWARWYRAAMAGTPLPWALQKQIALIPDEIWTGENAPEEIAKRIKALEDEFDGRGLDEEAVLAAADALMADPIVYSDIFASSAQQISVNIDLFQQQAQLNGLPDGFTGFAAVAGAFSGLSDLLKEASAKDVEIATLKAKIQTLNAVIAELRRELRDTRSDILSTVHSRREASRLAKVGKVAKETILLTGGVAAGLLAALQLGDRWSDTYQGLRADAYDLAETMQSLEAPNSKPNK